jgi:hypothetical protein
MEYLSFEPIDDLIGCGNSGVLGVNGTGCFSGRVHREVKVKSFNTELRSKKEEGQKPKTNKRRKM